MTAALIGFAIVLLLVFLRLPIAFAMGLVGFVGWWIIDEFRGAFAMVGIRFEEVTQNYELAVLPLFIVMGNFVSKAGLSNELYTAANSFLGHRRGGLSMATIVACGGFSAICGSSLATAATMSKVAMPSMRRYGYHDTLATASIAAGGTLGILIPPSVVLVIYGLMTETSIRELFAAGFLPGMLGVILYLFAVQWVVMRKPEVGPRGERVPWRGRWVAMSQVGWTLFLFVLVMGGIYIGLFTPNEAAGVGAGGAFGIALLRGSLTPAAPEGFYPFWRWLFPLLFKGRFDKEQWAGTVHYFKTLFRFRLDWRSIYEVLLDSARTSATLFIVLIGALIFSNFINRADLPGSLLALINGMELSPYMVIMVIVVIYILLGCVFESLSMLLLTIPIFFPLVQNLAPGLGIDPRYVLVWFGIIAVVVTEISLITPPVGLNVFVLSGVLKDVKTTTIFKGVTPFWCADIIRLMILLFIPWISLYLPRLFYSG